MVHTHTCQQGSTKNRYRPVRVSTITEGGAAEETGLCIGDRIISVNGQAIEGRGYKEVGILNHFNTVDPR